MNTKLLKQLNESLSKGTKVDFESPADPGAIAGIYGGKVWHSKDGKITNVYLKPMGNAEKLWFSFSPDFLSARLRSEQSVSYKDLCAIARRLADVAAERINRDLVYAVEDAWESARIGLESEMTPEKEFVARMIANNRPLSEDAIVETGFVYLSRGRYEAPIWFAGVKDLVIKFFEDFIVEEYEATDEEMKTIEAFLAKYVDNPPPPHNKEDDEKESKTQDQSANPPADGKKKNEDVEATRSAVYTALLAGSTVVTVKDMYVLAKAIGGSPGLGLGRKHAVHFSLSDQRTALYLRRDPGNDLFCGPQIFELYGCTPPEAFHALFPGQDSTTKSEHLNVAKP